MSGRFVLIRINDDSKVQRANALESGDGFDPQSAAFVDPVDRTLGFQVVHRTPDRSELTVVCRPDFENNAGGLHGGVSGLLGERACSLALEAMAGDDCGFRVVSLRVAYLRPVAIDGKSLTIRTEVLHAGRTQASTESRIFRADGKLAVQVSATHSRSREWRTE